MADIIALDWGTSHLRAYLCKIQKDGQFCLVDTRLALGVAKCQPEFEQELINCIKPWSKVHGKLPIVMAGQISSSIGWLETDYLPCPIVLSNLADACVQFNCQGHQISVVPGVSCRINEQNYDVMRGEEIQVSGWLDLQTEHRQGKHLLCLPGTHTKWVLVHDGEIVLFKTAMTGELFDLLSHQSVLIQKPSQQFDAQAFAKGARYTLDSELGNFSHGVFSVRSKQLFGELSQQQASSYLSGLLIGTDVRAAINASQWNINKLGPVSIIGAQHLSQCFSIALNMKSIETKIWNETQTSIQGFSSLYQHNQAVIVK